MVGLMNELVKLENNQIVTTSKIIADVFGKRHDHVLRDIENYEKDLPNFGEMFFKTTILDNYNREQKAYLMNRDGFSLLAMGFTGKEAMGWKLKYIEAFNNLEKAWNTPELVMARGLEASKKLLEQKETEIKLLKADNEEMKPKALFADAVASSKTSILIGELAKLLKQNGIDIGQNRLFDYLRDNGYLIKSGISRNMPTQRSMEQGLFEIKENNIINPDGSVRITKTPKVTGKGQVYFINHFIKTA